MGKRKQKKNNVQIIECNNNHMSKENLIEIQAEAYYRALKRIEDERLKEDDQKPAKKKYTRVETFLFIFNFLFWPWKINKKFTINNRVYDGILIMFVSGVLYVIGFLLWLVGMLEVINVIRQVVTIGITENLVSIWGIAFFLLLFGSVFTLAGREFEKETDSNRIYAYSASIIALISCVVSIITLVKTFW